MEKWFRTFRKWLNKPNNQPTNQGKASEQKAQQWLEKQGLVLKHKNFSCKLGEIDLIMQHNDCLVFIEVRERNQTGYGGAIASVDFKKQQKIIKTAKIYLNKYKTLPNCRFDVVTFENGKIDWIQAAFYAE